MPDNQSKGSILRLSLQAKKPKCSHCFQGDSRVSLYGPYNRKSLSAWLSSVILENGPKGPLQKYTTVGIIGHIYMYPLQ